MLFAFEVFRKISGRRVFPEVLKGLLEEPVFRKSSGVSLRKLSGRSSSFGKFLEEGFFRMTFQCFRKHFPEESLLPKIMARIRGLGRAIGRLIDRDRHDDHDAADVPERRRPTASARRQRVHQMTADAPDMAEDVADMTKDVPDLAEEALEMIADVQGTDGAEGSDVDDVEGFLGEPRDSSVLTSFADHVAHAVWSGQERPDLKLVSHGRKVTLIGRPVLEIEGLVGATGLSPLIDCSVVTGDLGLVSAFVERWYSETSTFHLSVGELTITLDDVSSLLHLPITGALHNFHALSAEEAIFLLTELLEVSAEEARAETTRSRGAYLDEASWTTTRQIAGYLTLLQHFPSVHQCVADDAYQEMSSRASRWLTSKAHMKGITGAPYRARCDALTVTDVSWLPYTKHQGVRAFELISSFQGQLRWGPMVVTARPERVVSADYMEWFFWISHLFMIPTQAGDQPKDAPAADPEEYIQPPSPPHPVDDYDGYEVIAQRLERVLNLRMVTAGTELYDIMQDCLTIARGGASADGSVRARQRRRTEH
ncbi:Protein MAIN-LIKE 2 [Glycine max]|nr:Protein MAIN-LIKE 2 [Glycine max]